MKSGQKIFLVGVCCLCALAGCQTPHNGSSKVTQKAPVAQNKAPIQQLPEVEPVSYAQPDAELLFDEAPGDETLGDETSRDETLDDQALAGDPPRDEAGPELLPLPESYQSLDDILPEDISDPNVTQVELDQVINSVRSNFPLIRQAAAARGIAAGEALSAMGAFDHKFDVFSESQPLDFYENYRNSAIIKRDTMWGGQVFGGYRIGRGEFEPWYLERETNEGGEFKVGFRAPIIRDRWIDANRAALWQARLERRRVEPEILAQIILFVRDGSVAYWDWVAAGRNYRIAEGLLALAQERNEALEEQVKAEEKAGIVLVDNRRIIVSREAKLIAARRKLEQAAVKMSLFYRTPMGVPLLAIETQVPSEIFPDTAKQLKDMDPEVDLQQDDENLALALRPELNELQIVRQQLNVALRQARNETLPDVDGGILLGQDMGSPTSSKRDKSELELEALLTVSVPLERRKALGKVRSLRSKLAQVAAKNQFTSDKIVAEVRLARAALLAAQERVVKATESFELALQMLEAERELFVQGQSNLFNLNIREIQAAEAAAARVDSLLEYFVAKADYAAAIGFETPNQ